ncbi:putative RNA-directed DNA polymerase [Tanacetum coccineum]
MIEVQFDKQIKRVRCDNGGEFTSNDMLEFYNEKGILLETTCPHTPQQNGVVERKHRHLLETARALRIGANLSKRFWGECILTEAHVINRLPSKFSTNHKAFLSAITNNDEPRYFKQAAQDAHWREAMQKDIKALEKNETWTLEDLPKVAVKRDWIIHQLDVNNAFLHGDLDEEVYMKIPQGFSKDGETRVCRLRKSLYGLKQASRNWYHKFTIFLSGLSFRQFKADHSLFIYETASITVVVLIYVDDVIITRNCLNKIQEIKKQLDKEFNVKDLGPLKYFLGIEVAKTSDGLVLSHRKYTLDILKDSGKLGCKPSSFPIKQGLKLDKGENEPSINASQYRHLIGRVLYLQATRPDITYSVNVLSQFVADLKNNHLEAANRVLRYLKATPGQGILLSRAGDPILTAYCDSDWLGCSFTRRLRIGYFLLLGGTPISWKTKK